MGKFFFVASISLLLSYPVFSIAEEKDDYNWQPKPNELLPKPVNLKCDGFSVIEAKSIKIDEKVINGLNLACQISLTKFPKWAAQNNWILNKKPLTIKISLLPASPFNGGKDFRNLNDTKWRFSKIREKGECCFWGFYLNDYNHVFLRNDVLTGGDINHNFLNTMVHEIGHVQSVQFGIRNKYLNDSKELDEEMIQNFTKWALKGM